MVAGGYRAIDALRVEKGYRVWGADVTPEDKPYEAGLGFAVRLDKPSPFVGRDALRRGEGDRPGPPPARAWCSPTARVALGSEPVRIDGDIVGRVTSGGYGFRVGRRSPTRTSPRIAPTSAAGRGRGVRRVDRGEIVRDPLYDPAGRRIRA